MADEDTPDAPETPPAGEGPETTPHAVPSEEAQEIAGSAEDAALEAAEEAQESGGETPPEPATAEPAGEGHAVPTAEAQEIAGSVEDAALEAAEEASDAQALAAAESEDEPAAEGTPAGETPAGPREKQSVPGAHLEVDIVPEGVDPLNRVEEYADPYAVEEEGEQPAEAVEGEQEETLAEPISTATIDLGSGARYRATGKRKTAIARVTLRPGTGTYLVNGRTLEDHFPRNTLQRNIRQPLETVGYEDRMDVVARLHGGGISAQAGALRHGVSRALLEADPNLRGELKRRGFLTRDSRAKERKKAGLKKARKRPQFSKR
jgi:small subunit ribosomal protein S9